MPDPHVEYLRDDEEEDSPDPVQGEVSDLKRRVQDLENRNRELRRQTEDYHTLQSLYKQVRDDLKSERLSRERMEKEYEEKLEVVKLDRDQAAASSTSEPCKHLGADDANRNEKLWHQVQNLVGDFIGEQGYCSMLLYTLTKE